MSIEVVPDAFRFVAFDSAYIARIAEHLANQFGMQSLNIRVEVDETTPLARITVELGEPVLLKFQSGAFEDTKRPRQQSELATTRSIGRALLKVRDRMSEGFADAPADDDLTLAQVAAWDTYIVARLARNKVDINQQQWRYNFRNRHGFTDMADIVFDTVWDSDELTWDELSQLSQRALDAVNA